MLRSSRDKSVVNRQVRKICCRSQLSSCNLHGCDKRSWVVAERLCDSGEGKLTYCAFFDKSTNFGTKVDQYIMNKFGGGATAELLPGGRGGHFPKWPPLDI